MGGTTRRAAPRCLLLGLRRLLGGSLATLDARQTALPFDDLVVLFAHGEVRKERLSVAGGGGGVKPRCRECGITLAGGHRAVGAGPAVHQGAARPLNLLHEGAQGALGQREGGRAGLLTAEHPGIGLEDFGPADHPGETGHRGRDCGAIDHEARVGKAAQIDAGALGEAHPVPIGVDAGRRHRELMAPVPLPTRDEESAGGVVGARSDDPRAQPPSGRAMPGRYG